VNIRSWPGRLNRLQQSRGFKIVASCVIVLATVASCIAYAVAVSSQASASKVTAEDMPAPVPSPAEGEKSPAGDLPPPVLSATGEMINDILSAKQSSVGFVVGASIVMVLALVITWLGLALSYLGFAVLGAGLSWFFAMIGRGRDLGIAAGGLVGLVAAFTALVQLTRLLLAGPHPVTAIARNVVNEAVRMKVSLIFIVLMVFGLATLPMLLDPDQPLRYRVQSFLQFSTAGSFWIIALLVLVFSVSTVATEQRDKVIWQTVTKPVSAWQYLLGKWLGVCTIAAALLLVSGSGVFLFTEYLRSQPAIGESDGYVTKGGKGLTEDRLILETQVLTARKTIRPTPRETDAQFDRNVEEMVEAELKRVEFTVGTPAEIQYRREQLRKTISESLRKSYQLEGRVIAPGDTKIFRFDGLADAAGSGRPIILRFKFDSGSNRPDIAYRLTVQFLGSPPEVIPIALGQFHSIPLTNRILDGDGSAELSITNGDVMTRVANPDALSFSPEGMELSYSAGSFRPNFFRCLGILWVKLAFLSILGICAGTFLSFPVASFVSMTIFLCAESAGYLKSALDNYATQDQQGNVLIVQTVTAAIATMVSSVFDVYADLRPTSRLVEGLELSGLDVLRGTIVLAGASAMLFALAIHIFRRRELALYSGQ
jgi:ABC-type transport system involved in multi-copper enzyme maturation permease subunit